MTNLKKGAAAILLLVAASGWTGVVRAEDAPCATELALVEVAIQDGVFLGKNASTDEGNLLAKLAAASAKVALNKYDDAVDKLLNISDTATALANASKPKLEDAAGINGAVAAAITCVGSL